MIPTIQQLLVSSYLPDFSVKKVLWHDRLVYRWIFFHHCLWFIIVWLGYTVFSNTWRFAHDNIMRATWILIIIVYWSCLYQLLDKYLDTFVISDSWLILFQRHHPFSQDITFIQRVSIESIQHTHRWFVSWLLNMGDIIIQVEDIKYNFRRIHAPMHAVNMILQWKSRMIAWTQQENVVIPTTPKNNTPSYDVLVEALWEVVHDYLKKKEM